MVNVGLVTGTSTPSARHAPRTNVVLPAPRSPETRTTSPGSSVAARSAASASVSGAEAVSALAAGMRPAPEGEAAEQEHEADRGDREGVEAGARQGLRRGALAGGGGRGRRGLRRRGGRGRGRGRRRLLLLGRRLLGGGRRRLRLRLRGGRGAERVLVLRVARAAPAAALGERGRRREERQNRDERGDAGPGRHDGRWYRRARMSPGRHILVLVDRDWTHPQAGGTGTVLRAQVLRWLDGGHRVTVIAGAYDGAERVSRPHERLEIHRMGTRLTVFPRAAWATLRGVGRDADVVLEVVNGIAFFTSLWRWLRKPRVLLVFHVHQEHYITELGLVGRVAAFVLEHFPLRFLYPGVPVVTISESSRAALVGLGIPREHVRVVYCGLDDGGGELRPRERAPGPTLVYLGRIKLYKRIELLLDVAAAIPDATLHVAGDGEHRAALAERAAELELDGRVVFHGHVDEATKGRLLGEAWLALTASSAEGWCLTVMEAPACATPTAAVRVGGLAEAIVDGQTGVLVETPDELADEVSALMEQPERLAAMGDAAMARARGFTWDNTASGTLEVMQRTIEAQRPRLRDALRRSESGKAAGLAAATLGNNAIQLLFTVVFTRLLGATGYGTLAALISAFLILLVAGQSVQVAAAREAALDRLGHPGMVRATLRAWTHRLLVALAVATVLSLLLRGQIAAAIGVDEAPWGAAAILPTGILWMLISLQ